MVRFTVLASGSHGNATLVAGGRTRILVDCGLSCRELFRRLRSVGEEPEKLDAILITHEHTDHTAGIAVTARRLGIPVFFTPATEAAWLKALAPKPRSSRAAWLEQQRAQKAAAALLRENGEKAIGPASEPGPDNGLDLTAAAEEPDASARPTSASLPFPATDSAIAESAAPAESKPAPRRGSAAPQAPAHQVPQVAQGVGVEHFAAGVPFAIGDIDISPFTTPHDAADPVGFVFRAEGVRMGLATDLGYLPANVKEQLRGLALLMLEANHDLEMLRDGPYPWAVKQRVLSRVGHLSNEATAGFLAEEYDGEAAHIILGHLSEKNNLPELARMAAEAALAARAGFRADRLRVARQEEPLEAIIF